MSFLRTNPGVSGHENRQDPIEQPPISIVFSDGLWQASGSFLGEEVWGHGRSPSEVITVFLDLALEIHEKDANEFVTEL